MKTLLCLYSAKVCPSNFPGIYRECLFVNLCSPFSAADLPGPKSKVYIIKHVIVFLSRRAHLLKSFSVACFSYFQKASHWLEAVHLKLWTQQNVQTQFNCIRFRILYAVQPVSLDVLMHNQLKVTYSCVNILNNHYMNRQCPINCSISL